MVLAQPQKIDSLKQELEHAKHDTTKALILNKLAAILPEGEWEAYNEKLEKLAEEKLKNATGKARKVYLSSLASAYNNKSIIHKYTGETTLALKYGEKSLDLFKKLDDKENISIISFNNGKLYFSLGDVDNAVRSIQFALKQAEKNKKQGLMTYCLNYLGFISKEQQEYDKALEYHHAAYDIAQKTNDQEALAYTLSCKGLLFMDQKKFGEALKVFAQSLKSYEELGNALNVAAQYQNMGHAYSELKQYEKANENLMKSLEMNTSQNYQMGVAASLNSIGQNYLKWGKEHEAEQYLKKSLDLGVQMGFPAYIHPQAQELYKIYRKRGELKKALDMYELYVQMRDSVNNEETRKSTLKAQYRYEYEKKATTDSLKVLEAKKLQEATIEKERTQARVQRYGLMAGIVFILGIGGFILQRIRLRQKVKELKIRNKIAIDLHDEVGSALSSISLLSGMARSSSVIQANTIEKIETTSRETVENMSDIVWSIQPRNDKLTDVVKRMKNYGQQLFTSFNTHFEFRGDEEMTDLPLNMEQRKNLYLIYKEALNNAVKYAEAKKVNVSISNQSKNITLVIVDDGKGFDAGTQSGGNGLYTMHERAQKLNGKLIINSRLQQGTTITLVFKTN